MRKILLTSSLLLCFVYAVAQTSSNPDKSQTSGSQDKSQTSSQGTSNHHKVRGCLSGSSGNYTLTDKSGTTYQLSGDTSKLAEHVGHTVEISGTPSSSGASSSTGGASPSGGTAGAGSSSTGGSAAEKTLNVASVKHISETCSNSH